MGRYEYLVERQRLERRTARIAVRRSEIPQEVLDEEWRAAPLGRLGRGLWIDIERYLEFFAIAEESTGGLRD